MVILTILSLLTGVVFMIVWLLDVPVQSVPITANVVSSNPTHGEVYLIQHYVIKFVSDLRQVSGFLLVLKVSSTNKTDRNGISEVLLKVALDPKPQIVLLFDF